MFPKAIRELLEKMRDQVAALSVGLRTISHRLHPAILTELGLVSALRSLVDDFRSSGGKATASFPNVAPELPVESATAIHRITQEALRNAMKHAPGAPVKMTLTTANDAVELVIEDAGPGFDPNRSNGVGGWAS